VSRSPFSNGGTTPTPTLAGALLCSGSFDSAESKREWVTIASALWRSTLLDINAVRAHGARRHLISVYRTTPPPAEETSVDAASCGMWCKLAAFGRLWENPIVFLENPS
jgi:hypothetical protein